MSKFGEAMNTTPEFWMKEEDGERHLTYDDKIIATFDDDTTSDQMAWIIVTLNRAERKHQFS